jgi:phosphotransferase system IIA component
MADEETTTQETPKAASRRRARKIDGGMPEAQDVMDQMNEDGFLGVKIDPLPNEAYSVQGQIDHPERTSHAALLGMDDGEEEK